MIIEPIREALETAGTEVEFPTFTVLCFPGFSTSILHKGEVSVYEVEKQNFTFEFAAEDVKAFDIKYELNIPAFR
jgi:hypothetical protein